MRKTPVDTLKTDSTKLVCDTACSIYIESVFLPFVVFDMKVLNAIYYIHA